MDRIRVKIIIVGYFNTKVACDNTGNTRNKRGSNCIKEKSVLENMKTEDGSMISEDRTIFFRFQIRNIM